jgi:hypothetical protein
LHSNEPSKDQALLRQSILSSIQSPAQKAVAALKAQRRPLPMGQRTSHPNSQLGKL